jgi:hypothetical protein
MKNRFSVEYGNFSSMMRNKTQPVSIAPSLLLSAFCVLYKCIAADTQLGFFAVRICCKLWGIAC